MHLGQSLFIVTYVGGHLSGHALGTHTYLGSLESTVNGLFSRQELPSFPTYDVNSLDPSLGDACVQALSTNITGCELYVQSFMQLKYRGSLGNTTLTDAICTATCESSLRNWFNSVSSACTGKTLNNAVPQRAGGFMWEGWNETCVRDPQTKKYCNGSCWKYPFIYSL